MFKKLFLNVLPSSNEPRAYNVVVNKKVKQFISIKSAADEKLCRLPGKGKIQYMLGLIDPDVNHNEDPDDIEGLKLPTQEKVKYIINILTITDERFARLSEMEQVKSAHEVLGLTSTHNETNKNNKDKPQT